ncbi:hypothetical protein N7468_000490 [Penicillium chermesinum]|uniref:Kynurenine formamidase n=1 Tax=Penicillium chermesinum TaxID=63820 RepID=A0A9W9PNE9_9EURO|nr:uncharacterized protein N7468_000490 [Penicillium chermesinum]KAJ5249039.1 hypothetical protein N7468_000490 [Penicillium chermesinum]
MSSSPERRQVAYGRHHELQNIIISPIDSNPDGYWVVQVIQTESSPQGHSYIHGGAWRDPTITASSFEPTEALLRSYPGLPISGFASISYRLSAHPDYPQNKKETPVTQYRDAKHPDHIRDVEAALAFLQNTYNFGPRYILVGHSCGATLAFQAVMGAVAGHREQSFNGAEDSGIDVEQVSMSPAPLPPKLTAHPMAIVGVAGIYDLRKLQNDHRDSPAYREIIEGAFGTDELLWDAVSPAQMEGSRGIEGGWKTGRLVVLAHSKDDELVDEGQQTALLEALKGWESKEAQIPKRELAHRIRHVRFLPISGGHDEAWSIGEELARAVKFTFVELQKMGIAPEPEFLGGSERV